PVDLDLEDQVLAQRQLLGRGRPVVLVEEAGPLDEPSLRDAALEVRLVDEAVRGCRLAGAARPRGPRAAQPEAGVPLHERAHDGALADPARAGDDDDERWWSARRGLRRRRFSQAAGAGPDAAARR